MMPALGFITMDLAMGIDPSRIKNTTLLQLSGDDSIGSKLHIILQGVDMRRYVSQISALQTFR